MNELEYVRFMLIAMHKVDKQLFDSLHDQFKKLDVQGDGTLNKNDLKIMAQRKMKSVNNKLALSIYKVRSSFFCLLICVCEIFELMYAPSSTCLRANFKENTIIQLIRILIIIVRPIYLHP